VKAYLFIALLSVLVQQAPTPEPYPGQRDHAAPPDGWFCSPTAKVKAHECHCKRMGYTTKDDPLCEDPGVQVTEDQKCTVWCHKDHCLCPMTCDSGHHH
jgi:hypothetical protein